MTASCKPLSDYFKVVVKLEHRSDGGLRAYSDDVPGFVLSHADPEAVIRDIKPALEGILSHMFGASVIVEELSRLSERDFEHPSIVPTKEYVTHRAGASDDRGSLSAA
jgi:hypothetical protein